jgi:hypothetical protein
MIRAYHDGAVEINAETMNQLYQLVMKGIKA